ncbi:hypothetical protein Tco_1494309 [Tanacetum coccineum]
MKSLRRNCGLESVAKTCKRHRDGNELPNGQRSQLPWTERQAKNKWKFENFPKQSGSQQSKQNKRAKNGRAYTAWNFGSSPGELRSCFVKKKDGSFGCAHGLPGNLNKLTVTEPLSDPELYDLFASAPQGSSVFSKIDLRSGIEDFNRTMRRFKEGFGAVVLAA